MIRTATAEDLPAVAGIWEAAFQDPAEYIRFFLQNLFQPERCLLSLDDKGRPVAMLHRIPAEYVGPAGQSGPVQYIYAAATLPPYRRQGRMAALIGRADALGSAGGCRFTFLLPASESLYRYYASHGFSPGFYAKRISVDRGRLAGAEGSAAPASRKPASMAEIFQKRRELFPPAVLWGPEMLSYAICEWKYGGGELLTFEGGYCLCRHTGGRVRVQETCVEPAVWPRVAALLLRRYPCDAFDFWLAPACGFFPEAETVPYGMLRPCGGDKNKACDVSHAYINLLLD